MSRERELSKCAQALTALGLILSLKSSDARPETPSPSTDSRETKKISLTMKELQKTQRDFLSPPVIIFPSPTPTQIPTFIPTPTSSPTPTLNPTPIFTPTSTFMPTPELSPTPEIVLSLWEEKMYQVIQELRKEKNFSTLELSTPLVEIARQRSLDMATRDYFSHTTPEGQMVFDLLDQTGIYYPYAGENLARTNLNDSQIEEVIQEIMKEFLESRGHRRNLLRPEFSLIGIGYAFSEEDNIKYITIVFTSQPQ